MIRERGRLDQKTGQYCTGGGPSTGGTQPKEGPNRTGKMACPIIERGLEAKDSTVRVEYHYVSLIRIDLGLR
jgi:hypothetical protein